jgi:predicted nucleic acid-binding protein
MIVLDTSVLSAVMQPQPDEQVTRWLDRQPSESVWITTITVFEIRFGLARLSEGRRRAGLEAAFAGLLEEDLENRILTFDSVAGERGGVWAADRQRRGRTVDFRDTEIAGIVEARQAVLATRNVRHFDDLQTQVVNPWDS